MGSELEEVILHDGATTHKRRKSLVESILPFNTDSTIKTIKDGRRRSIQRMRQGILGTASTVATDLEVENAIKAFYANERKLKTMIRTAAQLKAGNKAWVESNKTVSQRLSRIFLFGGQDIGGEACPPSQELVSSQRLLATCCELDVISLPSFDVILSNNIVSPVAQLLEEYKNIHTSIKTRNAIVTDLGAHKYSFDKMNRKIIDSKGKVKEVEYQNLEKWRNKVSSDEANLDQVSTLLMDRLSRTEWETNDLLSRSLLTIINLQSQLSKQIYTNFSTISGELKPLDVKEYDPIQLQWEGEVRRRKSNPDIANVEGGKRAEKTRRSSLMHIPVGLLTALSAFGRKHTDAAKPSKPKNEIESQVIEPVVTEDGPHMNPPVEETVAPVEDKGTSRSKSPTKKKKREPLENIDMVNLDIKEAVYANSPEKKKEARVKKGYESGTMLLVSEDYQAENGGELHLAKGDTVILQHNWNGSSPLAFGLCNGVQGRFPISHTKKPDVFLNSKV